MLHLRYDLYFTLNYWRVHWRKALTILSAYMLLSVFVFTSFSMVRTELRRQYFDAFNATIQVENDFITDQWSGAYDYILKGLEDEDAAASLAKEDCIGMTGRLYTGCYMGNDASQYTYGAYMDDAACELSGIKMLSGGFPQKTGEVAVSEMALFHMGIEAEPGDSITLTEYDDAGHAVGERAFTLAGIFKDSGERCSWETQTVPLGELRAYEPVILLSPADMDTGNSLLSVMFRFKQGAWELSEEELDAEYAVFGQYADKCTYGLGRGCYDSSYFTAATTETYSGSLIYGKSRFYQYACIAAAIVMALSLLCSLFTAMPEKIMSMHVLRNIGYTYRRLRRLLILECVIFTAAGTAAGFLAGVGCYELLLQIQHYVFGLDIYRACNSEWGIRQVSFDPVAMTLSFTVVTSILAFGVIIFGLKRIMTHKDRVRPRLPLPSAGFHTDVWKIFRQPFVQLLQAAALVLVLTVGCAAAMFFSIRGKDGKDRQNPQFQNGQGMTFKTAEGLDMNENDIDCVIRATAGESLTSLVQNQSPERGLDEAYADKLSASGSVKHCYAWTKLYSLYAHYGGGEKAPRGLSKIKDSEFIEGEKQYYGLDGDDIYRFRGASIMIVNDSMIEDLGADAEALRDGKAFLLYSGKRVPFEGQKEGIPCYSCYGVIDGEGNLFDIEKHEASFSLAFAGAKSIKELSGKAPNLLFRIYENEKLSDNEYIILFSQRGAKSLGLLNGKFNNAYLSYSEGAHDSDVTRLLGDVNLTKAELSLYTLAQRQKSYDEMKLKENVIVFTVFGLFMVLALTGYLQAIRLEVARRRKQISTLRAVGFPQKKVRNAIVLKLMVIPVLSCALGALSVSGLQSFLEEKNEEVETEFHDALKSVTENTDPKYVKAEEKYAEVCPIYLLDYEMWKVPIWDTFMALAISILLCMGIFSYVTAAGAVRQEIIPEKEE